jgi:D-beta-D-heptose 7-phosphate kinase/D-beta-D-heptose 1-phosphate adenosyltransferase
MKKFFLHEDKLLDHINKIREFNKIIGFTNGCFDLLHDGHLLLISESKKKCDFLVIGLNSDSSIKKIKGKDRPYENENKRIENLELNNNIDAIIVFNDKTPLDLIKKISPDILIKGADYINKIVIGSDHVINNGGKVDFVEILPGYSTTNIIKNMKTL